MTPSVRNGLAAILAAVLMALAACSRDSESTLADAKANLAAGQHSEAILQLKTVLQGQPQLAEGRFLLGKALFESGNMVNAKVELRKALDLGHARAEVLPVLCRSMLAMGQNQPLVDEFGATTLDVPAAEADLKTSMAAAYAALARLADSAAATAAALRAVPGNPDTLLLQARLAANQRRFGDAAALVEQVIAASPANAQAWQQKGDLQMLSKGDATGAVSAYRKALEHDPKHVGALSNLLATLILQRDLKGATEQFTLLQKALPNNPQTTVFEAQLALLDNKPQRAKQLIDMVLRVAPDNLKVLQLAASIEIRNGELLRAERTLGKVVTLAPDLRPARNQLAEILVGQGQSAKALSILQPLRAGGTADSQTHALAGLAQLQEGLVDEAIASFSQAVKMNPGANTAQTYLALAQMRSAGAAATVETLRRIASTDKGQTADMALVSLHVRAKAFDAALKALDGLQAKEKDNPSTALLRGRIHLMRHDLAAARASFEQALALDPSFVQAASILAGMELDQKNVEAAKKRLQDVLIADPKSAQAMLGLTKIMALEGAARGEIAQRLEQAIKLNPSDPDARLALVNHHLANRSVEAALTAAQEAVAALPESVELLDVLGRVQMQSGANNMAIGTFTRLAAQEPHSPRAYLRLSGVYLATNNKHAAEQNLRRALTISPSLLEAQRALARMALMEKRPQDALRIAKTVQTQRPKEAVGYIMEGDVERSRNNARAEIAVYREALRKLPSTELAKKLHSVLMGAKLAPEADKLAASWTAEHPRDVEFQAFLGDLAMARSQFDLAERKFGVVLNLQPDNALAMNNLAWIYNKHGRTGAAIEMAEQAVKLHPKAPGLMDTLAMVLAADGKLPRAIETQKSAVALSPDTPELRLNLAKLYIKAGDKLAARTELQVLEKLGTRYGAQAEVKRLLASL